MTARIQEIDKELFILQMKDIFDDKDRAHRDRLTAERRALVRAESREEAIKEKTETIIEQETKAMDNGTNTSIIEAVDMSSISLTMGKIQQFQALVKSQLAANHDYGVIPGTKKPTLLKPGAEKILMLMGLTSEFDILDSTRNFEDGFFQYQVKCRLYKNGILITEGLASCNTKETKYIKQDPYTLDNTMLKMAKKRALIDATLLVASLSQIFTQDVEDMDLKPQPAIKMTVINDTGDTISEAQARRIFAISKGNTEICHEVCGRYGYTNSRHIKKSDYDAICAEISQMAAA